MPYMCDIHRADWVRCCASESNRLLDEGCGVRVEPKDPPGTLQRAAGICAFIRASADVTTVCVICTGVEKVWVVR